MDKISIIYQRVEPNEEHEESNLNVKDAFEHKKPPENENTKEQLLENCAHNYYGFLGVNQHKFPNPYFKKEGQILAVDSNSDVDEWRSKYRDYVK